MSLILNSFNFFSFLFLTFLYFCNLKGDCRGLAQVSVRKVGTAQSTILPNGKALETTTASATENYRPQG